MSFPTDVVTAPKSFPRERVARGPLLASICASVAVAAILYGVIAALGLNTTLPQHWPNFAPPRATIGGIWVVLFAAMGAARYLAATSGAESERADAKGVVGLMLLCLAYPLYTHAVRGHATELVGNVISLAYAAWLIARLRAPAPGAAWLVGLVAVWIAFATVLVFGLIQLNGWAT
jgi:tryptophan-rich sensory protein